MFSDIYNILCKLFSCVKDELKRESRSNVTNERRSNVCCCRIAQVNNMPLINNIA